MPLKLRRIDGLGDGASTIADVDTVAPDLHAEVMKVRQSLESLSGVLKHGGDGSVASADIDRRGWLCCRWCLF